jgi:hypothetical protein
MIISNVDMIYEILMCCKTVDSYVNNTLICKEWKSACDEDRIMKSVNDVIRINHTDFNIIKSVANRWKNKFINIQLNISLVDKLEQIKSLEFLACLDYKSVHTLSLLCPELTDITSLSACINLVSLDISYCVRLKDITPLKDLKLHTLIMHSCNAMTLTPISIPTLCVLDVGMTFMSDLSCLVQTSLHTLDISNCSQLCDLRQLKHVKLHKLNISGCRALSSLKGLERMPLLDLDISYCSYITNLKPLRKLSLRLLNMSYCKRLNNLTPLVNMKALHGLNIAGTSIIDLSSLRCVNTIFINPCQFSEEYLMSVSANKNVIDEYDWSTWREFIKIDI